MNDLGRGIEVNINGNDICLKRNLPSTLSDIKNFYSLISAICQKIRIDNFYRDNENGFQMVNINNISHFIDLDFNDTIKFLKQLYDMDKKYCFPCAISPVYLDKEIIKSFGIENIDNNEQAHNVSFNFEKYLNDKQAVFLKKWYYGHFVFYKKNTNFSYGIMELPLNNNSIIPLNPYNNIFCNKSIDQIYIGLVYENQEFSIKYTDFIKELSERNIEKYDACNIVANINEEFAAHLIELYGIKKDILMSENYDYSNEKNDLASSSDEVLLII